MEPSFWFMMMQVVHVVKERTLFRLADIASKIYFSDIVNPLYPSFLFSRMSFVELYCSAYVALFHQDGPMQREKIIFAHTLFRFLTAVRCETPSEGTLHRVEFVLLSLLLAGYHIVNYHKLQKFIAHSKCICNLDDLMDVFDAADRYKRDGHKLVVLAGRDYGSGK